jgi:hypothetical protein
MAGSPSDILTALQNGVQAIQALNKTLQSENPFTLGTFTMSAAGSTVVSNPAVTAGSGIFLQATNATAATLVGSNKSPYVSATTAGVSFTVTTANGTAAAGSETFDYLIVNT